MKILILSNNCMGLYKFRKELLSRLIQDGNTVIISAPQDEYTKELEKGGCIFRETELERHGVDPFREVRLIFHYLKAIRSLDPDAVLTYTVKPNIYGGMICRILKKPYISNITGLGTGLEKGRLLRSIILLLGKIGLSGAETVFFQNTENMDFMVNSGIVCGNHELLPGSGVNLSEYSLLEYPECDRLDFVFAGRIMEEKGIFEYIEAARLIREKYENAFFHVCGACDGANKDVLYETESQGTIIYRGSVTDMKEIYRTTVCTVNPTCYPEGMNNVLLESCACGRPVITTDRAGCREICEDGVNGYLVREKDASDLADKIERFILLPREEKMKMGLRSRKKAEKGFDRSIVIEKYINVLNSIKEKYGL